MATRGGGAHRRCSQPGMVTNRGGARAQGRCCYRPVMETAGGGARAQHTLGAAASTGGPAPCARAEWSQRSSPRSVLLPAGDGDGGRRRSCPTYLGGCGLHRWPCSARPSCAPAEGIGRKWEVRRERGRGRDAGVGGDLPVHLLLREEPEQDQRRRGEERLAWWRLGWRREGEEEKARMGRVWIVVGTFSPLLPILFFFSFSLANLASTRGLSVEGEARRSPSPCAPGGISWMASPCSMGVQQSYL
jgi:hypothetical protein